MKKQLAIVGLTAGLGVGAAAGFAFTGVSPFAGAQDDPTTTVAPAPADSGRPDPRTRIREALKGLVEDKTLTQAQADKVVEALAQAAPQPGDREGKGKGGPGNGHGRGHGMGQGMGGGRGGPGLDAAAKAIGISADKLRTAVRSGQSIADIAEGKGVDISAVVDAMVAEAQEHLAEEVASGEHTQAEADERLEKIKERITAHVNGEAPSGGRGGPGGK